MNGLAIGFSDNSEMFAKFGNVRPISDAAIFLSFLTNWVCQNILEPFIFEIRAAGQNTRSKIIGRFHRDPMTLHHRLFLDFGKFLSFENDLILRVERDEDRIPVLEFAAQEFIR